MLWAVSIHFIPSEETQSPDPGALTARSLREELAKGGREKATLTHSFSNPTHSENLGSWAVGSGCDLGSGRFKSFPRDPKG